MSVALLDGVFENARAIGAIGAGAASAGRNAGRRTRFRKNVVAIALVVVVDATESPVQPFVAVVVYQAPDLFSDSKLVELRAFSRSRAYARAQERQLSVQWGRRLGLCWSHGATTICIHAHRRQPAIVWGEPFHSSKVTSACLPLTRRRDLE